MAAADHETYARISYGLLRATHSRNPTSIRIPHYRATYSCPLPCQMSVCPYVRAQRAYGRLTRAYTRKKPPNLTGYTYPVRIRRLSISYSFKNMQSIARLID